MGLDTRRCVFDPERLKTCRRRLRMWKKTGDERMPTSAHRKILILALVTSLVSALIIAVLDGGVSPWTFLGWCLSIFALIYPTLLVTGKSGGSCHLDAGASDHNHRA
jgi:hypothetical protein